MKQNKLLIVALLAMACAMEAPAQGFLKKLGNKVKQTVKENVQGVVKNSAEIMVGTPNNADNHKTDSQANAVSAQDNASAAQANKDDEKGGGHGPGAGSWKEKGVPAITVGYRDFVWEEVSDVRDDIFFLKIPKQQLATYRFYNVKTAQRVSTSDWSAHFTPHFDGGVCAVKSTRPYGGNPNQSWTWKYRWYVLKSNGDSIALDPSIEIVGNFCDGLAVAGDGKTLWFINTEGKRVYPHLRPTTYVTYPLIDGLRRLYVCGQGSGYIDKDGRIVIQPTWGQARNFSGDHAIVTGKGSDYGKRFVINRMGERVSEIPSHYRRIGNFINGGTMALNDNTDKVDVLNTQMQVLASFDNGTGFYLSSVPADAGRAIVSNSNWEHPRYCYPNGSMGDEVFYKYERKNGDVQYVQPEPGQYFDALDGPEDLCNKPVWGNTGLYLVHVNLVGDYDALFDYQGVVLPIYNPYKKIGTYGLGGYAKGLQMSTKQWNQLGLTGDWAEELESHMVFFNRSGEPVVEIVDPFEE